LPTLGRIDQAFADLNKAITRGLTLTLRWPSMSVITALSPSQTTKCEGQFSDRTRHSRYARLTAGIGAQPPNTLDPRSRSKFDARLTSDELAIL
jgi:hypothetical protein